MAFDLFLKKQTSADWSLGGLVITSADHAKLAQQADAFRNKVDDLRYDVRKTGSLIGSGVFALAAAIAFVGMATVFRTAAKLHRSR